MSAFSSPRSSRIAAIALLVFVLFVVYSLTIGPLISAYARVNTALAESAELLQRYRQIASQREVFAAELDKLAFQQDNSGVYLPGDTDALAAARLQEIVNSTVVSGGGQLRSVQILPAKDDGTFRKIGVRAQMTGNVAAVARILYAFEAGDIFLFIENIDISNRRARRRNTDRTDPELLIRVDLSGYLRPEAPG